MRLAAVGSNCIDYYKNINKITPGGGPLNVAVYAVRNGNEASYIGPVGNDEYGRIIYEAVKNKGVDVSHLKIVEGKTAVSEVKLINNERVFGEYDEGVLSNYTLSEEDIDFISSHDAVICDLWGKVGKQFKQLKERNIITAFDCANRPDDEEALSVMPYTDYLFFSADKDNDELRKQMITYQNKGSKMVIAMLGKEGSLCYDGSIFHKFGIVKCDNLVDTMGAGDSYIAGFLEGIVGKLDIEECMYKGALCASVTIQYFGAW